MRSVKKPLALYPLKARSTNQEHNSSGPTTRAEETNEGFRRWVFYGLGLGKLQCEHNPYYC